MFLLFENCLIFTKNPAKKTHTNNTFFNIPKKHKNYAIFIKKCFI